MKKRVIVGIVALAVVSCGEAQTKNTTASSTGTTTETTASGTNQAQVVSKKVTAEEFKALMADKNAQLVDVRTSGEYNGGHIADAQNIDFMSSDFQEKMAKLDKTKPVLIYCHSGNRSGRAAVVLQQMGFTQIYDLQGGYSNWH